MGIFFVGAKSGGQAGPRGMKRTQDTGHRSPTGKKSNPKRQGPKKSGQMATTNQIYYNAQKQTKLKCQLQ